MLGLRDSAGTEVVRYTYDAWGKLLSTTGTMAATLGKLNPFRYRGYVYDEETGLYYLRSRYYNPNWGRFVNADNVMTGNLFAYCMCNPVCKKDANGNFGTGIFSPDGEEEISIAGYENYGNPSQQHAVSGIELMTKQDLVANFVIGKAYIASLTDLITGITFEIDWIPKDKYHTDFWFADNEAKRSARNCIRTKPKQNWDDPNNWSKNARPGMLMVKDINGLERKIAVGFILFPHNGNYSFFSQNGEMCMFYGDDTMGFAREHGNEAAINAYNGYYVEVLKRSPAN